MGQQGAVIYDPSTKRFVSAAELAQRPPAAAGPAQPPGPGDTGNALGFGGPNGQFVGFQNPPTEAMEPEFMRQLAAAFPQFAGLLLQAVPQVRGAGAATQFAIPAAAEAFTEAMSGDDFNVDRIIGQGAMGVGAKYLGNAVGWVGDKGTNLVRRSLHLRPPFDTRAAEELLPKLAIRERAAMTQEGVDAIANKANATGSGGLDDLAQVLERIRSEQARAPLGGSGGVMALARDVFDPAKQLAAGQKLAAPFGVNTKTQIAPAAEGAVRAFMTWLSSQLPSTQSETRRRPLQ